MGRLRGYTSTGCYRYLELFSNHTYLASPPATFIDTPLKNSDFRGINIRENCVYQLYSECEEVAEKNLCLSQFAYRDGGSSTSAVLRIYLKEFDQVNCETVRLFAMDFSKAFDGVSRNLLGEKLKLFNLNPFKVNWYLSFLKDRE